MLFFRPEIDIIKQQANKMSNCDTYPFSCKHCDYEKISNSNRQHQMVIKLHRKKCSQTGRNAPVTTNITVKNKIKNWAGDSIQVTQLQRINGQTTQVTGQLDTYLNSFDDAAMTDIYD